MPYIELADGVPLYYKEHGSGPTIVLVPGWTITTRFWERQVEGLAGLAVRLGRSQPPFLHGARLAVRSVR
jgi:pimeloyl-ACP methyl ester carboxylesterase